MVTASWGGGLLETNSGQIKLHGRLWTLGPLPNQIWKNSEYEDPREFYNISNVGQKSEF
jgi:hypothetical protein